MLGASIEYDVTRAKVAERCQAAVVLRMVVLNRNDVRCARSEVGVGQKENH